MRDAPKQKPALLLLILSIDPRMLTLQLNRLIGANAMLTANGRANAIFAALPAGKDCIFWKNASRKKLDIAPKDNYGAIRIGGRSAVLPAV